MDDLIVDRAFFALLRQLIRSDAIDTDDVIAAADDLRERGDGDAAHALMASIVEAQAPKASDWQAERRRERFRVVTNDGNPSD